MTKNTEQELIVATGRIRTNLREQNNVKNVQEKEEYLWTHIRLLVYN